MLDIKWIRDNPAALDAALAKRGAGPQSASLVALDEARRSHVGLLQALQERRNLASKDIGKAMAAKDQATADALKAEVATIKDELQAGEARERELDEALKHALSVLPNIPLDEVPVGSDESGNIEVRKVGERPDLGFKPKEHFELGETLGMMDFERAAKMSGARFTILTGALARLERALGQFMLDLHTAEHGYTEVNPPLMVNDAAAYGTDKLPKFGDDLFRTTDGRWLIPTAEVPLTFMAAGEIIADEELPRRYVAQTACFRSEAGSAGRDTRGMLRQHQFTKVELVSVTTPETSLEEHERMTASAENVLRRLGLHFRTIVLCTGDMGFGAQKTYDIEVWLPGQ
ncbi:MAG: serine--tRNA ligase, partial [Hoeflea sp.]|nr:serine--tRNA ligase [Hoeflea sp.]